MNFALIDSTVGNDDFSPLELPNVKPVLFDTAQAAARAGYLAAGATRTGMVGTYGGMPFPSVTVFAWMVSRSASATTTRCTARP